MSWNTGGGEHFIASNPASALASSVSTPAGGTAVTGVEGLIGLGSSLSSMAASGIEVNTEQTVVSYFPSGAATTYTHTGDTNFVDVDATNLIATVVVPPSGRFHVELCAAAFVSAGLHRWGLADANGNLTESQQVVANDAVKKRYTAMMLITKDSSGVALVPGANITLKWRFQVDNAANTATIAYGGATTATPDGPMVMRISPMSNRLTVRPSTAVLAAPNGTPDVNGGIPTDMWVDRKSMVGYSPTYLAYSADEGATWTVKFTAFDGGWVSLFYMYDGEILGIIGPNNTTHGGQLYRSSGWLANPATATFTKILDASGGNGTDAYFEGHRGFSMYGKIVFTCEYGPKVNSADMARYAYLSVDGGKTFRIVFDLVAQLTANSLAVNGTHMHGVAYDPWWDALWVVNGDYPSPQCTWLSFDHGQTWTLIYTKHQFTTIMALPNCILFGTDQGNQGTDGGPNGIYRIPRGPKDITAIAMQLAGSTNGPPAIGSAASNPSSVSVGWWRHPWIADAPTFLTFGATAASPEQLWITYDGYSFKKVWTGVAVSGGLLGAVGPTASGLVRSEWLQGSTHQVLTVTPA